MTHAKLLSAVLLVATLTDGAPHTHANFSAPHGNVLSRDVIPVVYTPGADLLELHYDHAPDPDDGYSAVLDRAILETAFGCGNSYVGTTLKVTGTYGYQMRHSNNPNTFRPGSYAVMNAAWKNCGGYLDAHDDWTGSVKAAAAQWRKTIQKGNKIFIKEGGMSDFTASVIKSVQTTFPNLNFRPRRDVILIQHSKWNEDETTPSDLKFVKNNANYIKIEDANPYLRLASDVFYSKFRSAASASKWGKAWDKAFDYFADSGGQGSGVINVVDCSDTGELMYILGGPQMGLPEALETYIIPQPPGSPSSPHEKKCRYIVDGHAKDDANTCQATSFISDKDGALALVAKETDAVAGARCCKVTATTTKTRSVCSKNCEVYTYEDASDACSAIGSGWGLCSYDQLVKEKLARETGCEYDFQYVWTSTATSCFPEDTLTLIDAKTDEDIEILTDGMTTTHYKKVNVRADFGNPKVDQVKFFLGDSNKPVQTEGNAPFALYGDNGGDYREGTLPTGKVDIVVKGFNQDDGKQYAQISMTITVEASKCRKIVDGNPRSETKICSATSIFDDVNGPDSAIVYESEAVAGARCCNGNLGDNICSEGCRLYTFAEARTLCRALGSGWDICSEGKVSNGRGKGCSYDKEMVWTLSRKDCDLVDDEPAPPPATSPCDPLTFEDDNGLVVIEAESLPWSCTKGTDHEWKKAKKTKQTTGDGFIKYRGNNEFPEPKGGYMTAKLKIRKKGTYKFTFHSFIEGHESTEENDSWLYIEASDFYAMRSNHENGKKYYPKGSEHASGPIIGGASKDGFMKMFRNGDTDEWTMNARTYDHVALYAYADFNKAGTYSLTMAGRSYGHWVDRLVLYHVGEYGDNDKQSILLTHAETRA